MARRRRQAITIRRQRAKERSASREPLARALAAARRAAGLTQAGLAGKIGTTQSAVARLERGEVAPSFATLSRLADALGMQFEVRPRSRVAVRMTSTAMTVNDLRAHRAQLLAIASSHGARDVRVFGSVARGDARPDSDVDFLVELEPGRTVLDLSGLILDLEDALGRKVHVVEAHRSSQTAERIHQEAIPL